MCFRTKKLQTRMFSALYGKLSRQDLFIGMGNMHFVVDKLTLKGTTKGVAQICERVEACSGDEDLPNIS